MRIHVLHDAKGRILAAVSLKSEGIHPSLRPVAASGQKSVELEVPAAYQHEDLQTICGKLCIDVKSQKLVVAKKSKAPPRRSAKSARRSK
jgi:hypothetical protein